MRRFCSSWYVAPIVAAAVFGVRPAAAQIDVDPPLPNVLLLLDSSGSMERKLDGTFLTAAECGPDNTNSVLNRWGTLATVLTGTVQDRRCYAQPRDDASIFTDEFGISGQDPHDTGYKIPYHRMVSGTDRCVVGAGTWPVDANGTAGDDLFEWPGNAISCHKYDDPTVSCDCDPDTASGWYQDDDGLLDVFANRVRFGLMTFDSHPDGGTGVSGSAVNATTGFEGLWSYYDGWSTAAAVRQARPDGCGTWSDFEVGARNPAAPPWEGRLIAMGKPDAEDLHVLQNNKVIKKAILAMRPYGATPLAGMMDDARHFLTVDTNDFMDSYDGNEYAGPVGDPYFTDGCRGNYIILLSDGEPNLDLRPSCVDSSGDESQCPYADEPHEIAYDLANTGNPDTDIETFVIGFGLSNVSGFDCSTIDAATDFNSGGECDAVTDPQKEACCTLARVAYNGGTDKAYFVDDMPSLRKALSDMLAVISAGSTSRTVPAFAGAAAAVGNSNADAKSYEFSSSFVPNAGQGVMWEGVLERKRWVCDASSGTLEAKLTDVDEDLGDVFSTNVNQATPAREFYTVFGDTVSDEVHNQRSIRPNVNTDDDSLGIYKGTTYNGSLATLATLVQANPKVMGLDPMPADCDSDDMGFPGSSGVCANRLLTWHLGGDNGTVWQRQSVFGAIYHSSPAVHGTPNLYVRDESYAVFAEAQTVRPLMLYTATTDGQLHGFKVASNDATETTRLVDSKENNELWSFIPPHVLPDMLSMYPGNQQILLDGQTVVRDVVYERTQAEAILGGEVGGADWSTVLVSSGGSAGGFYYALDITDPEAPQFLWQLSTDTAGNRLFGTYSTTPAVTSIAYLKDDGSGGTEVSEIAVAILPGGKGSIDTTYPAGCGIRESTTFDYIDEDPTTKYRPRGTVRCWEDGPARTLTIVRLSDGMILARFIGRSTDDSTTLDASVLHDVKFDSPISGVPVAYPSQTGDLSDRIYVGDADGTLWRIDLSSPDPADWDAHLMFDGYPTAYGDGSGDGQPIEVPPMVALDGVGNAVVLFATGDQENLEATSTMKTRVWSITEIAEAYDANVPFKVEHNWLIPFTNGKRMTGPFALFDEVAYFSTYTPLDTSSSTTVCTDGYGSIWGVDFVETESPVVHTFPYPEGQLAVDPTDLSKGFVDEEAMAEGVVVFGVAVTQVPSCYQTDDLAGVSWEGSGSFSYISDTTPPSYQLVFHTGKGGGSTAAATTKSETRVLPPLSEMAKIHSWASIVE
ncbi:MAG: hypothetical protein JRI23_33640 [Deltaproteobacteria bacterium]|jgi:type IV pilus assembly protein PilY1|nr:hypothetical protein [Deltaproteobacteria bacterium]MBW2537225.1 hypothetical protein [Deltaproteobacteria bacterium]